MIRVAAEYYALTARTFKIRQSFFPLGRYVCLGSTDFRPCCLEGCCNLLFINMGEGVLQLSSQIGFLIQI
ncbi:hypothetical protein D3C73_910220 [compost metagenome]